jgi:hypothetical protein
MNHLPNPIDGTSPTVPFYAQQRDGVYLPGDFFLIPQEKEYGYTDFENLLDTGLRPDMGIAEANQFLQSWLFFALLACVLGKPVHVEDFRGENDVLNTSPLAGMLKDWAEAWKKAVKDSDLQDAPGRKNQYVQASMALESSRRFVWKHLAHRPHDEEPRVQVENESGGFDLHSDVTKPRAGLTKPHDEVDPTMTLSITSLGEILQEELAVRLPQRQKDRVEFWKRPEEAERNWGYSRWCRIQMQNNNWCPHEIRRVEAMQVRANQIYYACLMKSDKPEVDHAEAGCTVWQCKAGRKPTDEELSAKHFHDDEVPCQGQNVGVEEATLIEIIEQGLVPLVTWNKRGKLSCEGYNLEDEESVPIFGALSHSWAEKILHCGEDARQKNNRRMLPCQLSSLRDTFHRIFDLPHGENPLFWVDVLCLPRNYETKGKLLNKLNAIYSKARAVLVWDRNLLGRSKPCQEKYIEMNIRLRNGEWSWRLWTLPEAILGENLYVAFQDDCFVGMDEVVDARQSARADILHKYHFIWKAGHPFSSPIWHLRQQLRDGKLEFAVQRAWQALQFRMSSRQEDETIVLGSILGMDISKLLEIKAPAVKDVVTARMVETINALDATPGLGIPSGLVFLPRPKLNANRSRQTGTYGWAPESWMTMQISTYALFRPLKKTAYMMHKGLHVEFSGIILHCPKTPMAESTFWIPVSQCLHKWYKVKVDTGDWDWAELSRLLSGVQELCLVLNSHNPRERWELGLLVRKKGMLACGDVIWVQTVCRVWVRLETNTNNLKELKRQFREKSDQMIFGERVDNQRWCIEESCDSESV